MLVALFLPWYSTGTEQMNAWQSMAVDDVILALAACLSIAGAFVVASKSLSSISVATTSLAILPAVVGLVVTIYRLVSPAPSGDVSLEIGAWLGLCAAVAIAVGAWAGARDEGPARRSPEETRRMAQSAMANSEVLTLPGEAGESPP
jgi:hypothetical protein